jgi:hypothetical protein
VVIVTFGEWQLDMQMQAEVMMAGSELPDAIKRSTRLNILALHYETTKAFPI